MRVRVCVSALRQNAELAKLRQDCMKLTKELGEKAELLQADEQAKRGLEGKVSAAENQLAALQVGPSPALSFSYRIFMHSLRHSDTHTQTHSYTQLYVGVFFY